MLALDPEALIYSKHGIFIIFRRKLHEFFGCFFCFFVFTIDVFFDEISQLDQKKKKKIAPMSPHSEEKNLMLPYIIDNRLVVGRQKYDLIP